MRTINGSEDINHHRRRFFGTAAVVIAAARLGLIGSADAQSSKTTPAAVPTIKLGANTSFGALQQTDAGVPVLRAALRPALGPDPGWLRPAPGRAARGEKSPISPCTRRPAIPTAGREYISTVAGFSSRAHGRAIDAVPSSMARGPDGANYVGELTGEEDLTTGMICKQSDSSLPKGTSS